VYDVAREAQAEHLSAGHYVSLHVFLLAAFGMLEQMLLVEQLHYRCMGSVVMLPLSCGSVGGCRHPCGGGHDDGERAEDLRSQRVALKCLPL
jgi:hypothetical protein